MKDQSEEKTLIGKADAIPSESTMVVSLEDALLTHPAMMRAWGSIGFTSTAESPARLENAGQDSTATSGVYRYCEPNAGDDIEIEDAAYSKMHPVGSGAIAVNVWEDDGEFKVNDQVYHHQHHAEC